MKNIKCRSCFFYRNEWCEKIVDSPDPEKARDCNYFREMTNADSIRAMTDEELLGFLMQVQDATINRFAKFELPNYNALADWLQHPSGEEDN